MSDVKLPVRKGEYVSDKAHDDGFGEVCLDEYWRILDADGAEVCRANAEPIADQVVRAVNSHAALVEACISAKTLLRLNFDERKGSNAIVLNSELTKALALAEPDQPTKTE